MKYAAIYEDEGVICTQFYDTEEDAWKELRQQEDCTQEELESAYYVQGFTQKQIDELPDVDL